MPKTVLFAWELGGGLGHLMQMLPLARGLARSGHRVAVALRHLSPEAGELFGRVGVSFLQAPFRSKGTTPVPRPDNFAHLLANIGFARGAEFFALVSAWRNLLRMVKPDLVVFDHSPTALLASRGIVGLRRALIGSGFCCPPDECPFPTFRPQGDAARRNPEQLESDEQRLLAVVNKVTAKWGQPPLDRLGRLYSDVDENFLTTFPELDHYPDRRGAHYWGPVIPERNTELSPSVGHEFPTTATESTPRWPDVDGKRVFAYLKRAMALPRVLQDLYDRGCPTLAYVEGVEPAVLRERFNRPSMRFTDRPLDLHRVGPECDLAVLNAGHGVTVEMLLAGKPILEVPLVLEQKLTADAVTRLGAGEVATLRREQPWEGGAKLDALLADDRYARAARLFARRYVTFDPERQRRTMLQRADELLAPANSDVNSYAFASPHSGHTPLTLPVRS